jgi:anhydro-N-acetylmuramic acid kinase
VEQWLQHPYFDQPPPKSTGRELFGQVFWQDCQQQAQALGLAAADVLASLTEFTALTIARSYQQFLPRLPDEVLVCGGGSFNGYLLERLRLHLGNVVIGTTGDQGVPADLKEALAFAVLGYWRYHDFPGNLPSVTGATRAVTLGELAKPTVGIAPRDRTLN